MSSPGGNSEAFNEESVEKFANELAKAASHPAFLQMLAEIQAAPADAKTAAAERAATVAGLRERGIPLPAGGRITTRYFENPGDVKRGDSLSSKTIDSTEQLAAADSHLTVCLSVGAVVCFSVGGPGQGSPELPPHGGPHVEAEHPKPLH